MRKEQKSFTVEVKRRPGVTPKKPRAFVPPQPEPASSPAAEALFRAPAPAAEPPGAPRRILPCLVTEAALDAAQAEALADPDRVPRPRGRPRKQRDPEDIAPLAPRKRGRPRKLPAAPAERLTIAEKPARPAPVVFAPVAFAPPLAPISERAAARRAATAELPRGERWKRRLPKALR